MKRFLVAACAAMFALSPITADGIKGDGWYAACEDDAGKIKLATETIEWEKDKILILLDGMTELANNQGDRQSATTFTAMKSIFSQHIDTVLMSMQLGKIDLEAK